MESAKYVCTDMYINNLNIFNEELFVMCTGTLQYRHCTYENCRVILEISKYK